MTVNLYTNKSEKNAVNKSLTNLGNVSGTLREECNIVTPEIVLELTNMDLLTRINYAYISDFGRYYFLSNPIVVNNKLVRYSFRCDVLMSFWDCIKTNTAVIERQEGNFNLNLPDNQFRAYQNDIVQTICFPESIASPKLNPSNPTYILTTV